MDIELIVNILGPTGNMYEFNNYMFTGVNISVGYGRNSMEAELLFPINNVPDKGTVKITKARLIKVNPEADFVDVRVRVDEWSFTMDEVSKYLNRPAVGMLIKSKNVQMRVTGPDNVKLIIATLQLRDLEGKHYCLPLVAFQSRAELVDSLDNGTIVTGTFSLKKRRPDYKEFELGVVQMEKFK